MSRPRPALAVLPVLPFLSLLLFQPPTPGEAAASGHFSMSGEQVHIYNLVGRVEVGPGPGSSVTVDLAPGGQDAAQLGTRTWSDQGTFFVVTYPSDHLSSRGLGWGAGSSSSFKIARDGTFGDHPKRGGWLGRQVRVDGKGGGLEAWCDLKIAVPRGQRVSIHLGVGTMNATNVDGDIVLDASSANVSANRSSGRLLVDTGSGNIAVADSRGEITLDSGSGLIRASGLNAGTLVLDTGSGSVTVDAASAARITADTGSGRIALSGISCPNLHIDTGSGGVHVGLIADVDELYVDTGSGSVTIQAPPTLGAALHFETGSGGIDCDFPLRIVDRNEDTLNATLGDGRGRIVIDTGSGDLRLIRLAAR
ncbi:MAG: DUF4097 family beta strand repeat-containing protein [Candidatus Eisenbacteria bacterium]